ncbi:rRNA maturation RNase YbeY [Flavobacteriaceae bacterium LMO-SS05]
MISFNYETDFNLENEIELSNWISSVIKSEGFKEGDINYIYCDDDYLFNLNTEFLNHDTLTDVISFDYRIGKIIHGDIYISIERVLDNSKVFKVKFLEELCRVMVHGVLHYCGYNDKSTEDIAQMRNKENHYLNTL